MIPFPKPQPGAFASAGYPEGVPRRLLADPGAISHAAAALAMLAGECIDTLPREQFDEWRARAVFAASLGHHEGRAMAAYYIDQACVGLQEAHAAPLAPELEQVRRLTAAASIVAGMNRATRAVIGLVSPSRHAAVVAALRHDLGGL